MEGNNRKAPTVDATLKARYEKFRKTGQAPQHFKKTPNLWVQEHMYKTSWVEGDVVYTVEWLQEEIYDGLLPGRFTDKANVCHVGKYRVRPWSDPETQALDRRLVAHAQHDRALDLFHGDSQHRERGRKYRYLEIDNSYHDYFSSGLWELGYSKGECDLIARKNFYADVKRVKSFGESWDPLYAKLTASEELAPEIFLQCTDTLSGTESDASMESKTELLYELYLTVKASFEEKRVKVIDALRETLSR